MTLTDLVRPAAPGPDAPEAAARPYGRLRRALPLTAVLAVAVVLRVWAIDAVGFNSDEAVYAGQAASLAGNPLTSPLFPVFRAHPLLFQTTLSLVDALGGGDAAARLLVAVFGVATVAVVFRLGSLLYDRRVGLVAALLLALMPYHVGVSRLVLLDAPMTFFATATLYAFVRFLHSRRTRTLLVAGLLLGCTVLTKETAVLLVGGLFTFAVLNPLVRPTVRQALAALAVTGLLASVYPLTLKLAGGSSTGQSYLAWQLFRRANHPLWFYPQVVPVAMGLGVAAAAIAGLWFLRREAGWREALLVCWAVVPTVFFELWPVKGYQYLLVTAPVVVVLAARALVALPLPRRVPGGPGTARRVLVALVAVSLAVPSWQLVEPAPTTTFLAGSGGLPAGRETGTWIAANLPVGARVMTIGPSTANIVKFYGHRAAYGLSVSPNPLSRNPSYEPIDNPDRQLRQADIQYLVWDAFTADRSPFFAARLLAYVDKYHAVAVHTESIDLDGGVRKPVMTVYVVPR